MVVVVLDMTRCRAIDYTTQHGGLGVAGARGGVRDSRSCNHMIKNVHIKLKDLVRRDTHN
jgi:hypothetical protein